MFRMNFVLAVVLLLATNGSSLQSEEIPVFSEIYAFGDSSIAGTNRRLAGLGGLDPVAYPYGWTNGLNYFQFLALDLGFDMPVPSESGGNNFAWGGAMSGRGTFALGNAKNVGYQIDEFRLRDEIIHSNALVVLNAGFNDLRLGTPPISNEQLVENLGSHVRELNELGAQYFLANTIGGTQDRLGELNSLWKAEIRALENELEIQIAVLEVLDIGLDVFFNPDKYPQVKFRDGVACPSCNFLSEVHTGPLPPGNASEWFYYDSFEGSRQHVTSSVQRILADASLLAVQDITVPEPGGVVLLISGVVSMLLWRRADPLLLHQRRQLDPRETAATVCR